MTSPRRFSIAFACFSLALLGTSCEKPYGEYDHRDIPSSIHISAKTEGNWHAHATAIFRATNAFPIICTGVFNQGLTGRDERFGDISSEGTDIQLKQKWRGLCSYKFAAITLTCTDSSRHYEYDSKNSGSMEVTIRPLESVSDKLSNYPLLTEGQITVVNISADEKEFYGCQDTCENSTGYSIDKRNKSLKIFCESVKK